MNSETTDAGAGPLDGGVGRPVPKRCDGCDIQNGCPEYCRCVTAEQRDILRHALGLGRSDREYRNYFVTGPGSSDYANCEDLVGAGLMTKRPGHALSGGDPVYIVTEAGKMAARRETPNVGIERLRSSPLE